MHYIFQIQVYEGAHTAVGGGIDLLSDFHHLTFQAQLYNGR